MVQHSPCEVMPSLVTQKNFISNHIVGNMSPDSTDSDSFLLTSSTHILILLETMSTSNSTSSSSATGSSDTLSTLPQPSTVPPNYFTTYNSDFPLVNPNGQFTLFNWKNTSSSLQHKPFTGRTPPTTSSPNSMFLDRKSNPRIHDEHILSFFRNDLLGVAFFPSDQFIQLTFKDKTTFNHYLSNPQISINEKTIHLSPPRSHPRTTLVLHLHGLPIIPASAIS